MVQAALQAVVVPEEAHMILLEEARPMARSREGSEEAAIVHADMDPYLPPR